MTRLSLCLVATLTLPFAPAPAFAQDPPSAPGQTQTPPAAASASMAADTDDTVLKPAEPDFTLISLPTSLRVPFMKSAFRVTHRFTRPLKCDTCPNSLLGDAFGIDSGAVISLEYRFGIVKNGQIGINRNGDKTIELFGEYGLTRQSEHVPVETSVMVSLDSTNVGRKATPSQYSPSIGVIITRLIGDQGAVYLEPMFVHHTNLFERATISHNDTFMIGLGARARIRPTVYLVGEFAPRVSGYKPGVNHGSVAIEKRAGGHLFQLNFSNSFATQIAPIARGGPSSNDWYMGFNISRKFY